MLIFQGGWSNLELDQFTLYLLIKLRAWCTSTSLPRANEKGNINITRTPAPISRSTNYICTGTG